jgi:uncharacterized membrane protein YoaK (UPF0700 family)
MITEDTLQGITAQAERWFRLDSDGERLSAAGAMMVMVVPMLVDELRRLDAALAAKSPMTTHMASSARGLARYWTRKAEELEMIARSEAPRG